MIDFEKVFNVMDDLSRLVLSEPKLAPYASAVLQVRDEARALSDGIKLTHSMPVTPSGAIHERELAERIIKITSRMPQIDPDNEDPDSTRLFAQLNANLFSAIMFAVFIGCPDLVPRHRPS